MEKNVSENYVIPMLEKAFEVLDLMSLEEEAMGTSEISQRLKIPKTTVFRLMTTMQKWGYVEKSKDHDKYRLGKKLIRLGQEVASTIDIKEIAMVHLEELSKATGESSNLGILYEEEVLTVANVRGEDFYLISRLIPTSPLNCSAMGKLFLADWTEEALEAYFASGAPKSRTVHSIQDLDGYREMRAEIEKEGLSYDREEYEYGLTCIAAPIRNPAGEMVAAMSISGPTTRLKHKGEENLKKELLKASRKIEKAYAEVF